MLHLPISQPTTMNNATLFHTLQSGVQLLKNAWSEAFFDAPPDPHKDAQTLLAHAYQKPTSYLFAHGDEIVPEDISTTFFSWIQERANHKPIAYILEKKDFFGRTFHVNANTLIPRPETELLIEEALRRITPTTLVLDIGTGSGAIAITLAKESTAPILAEDISQEALKIATHNAQKLGAEDRCTFFQGNLLARLPEILTKWPSSHPINHLLICANLPYLSEHQWEALDPQVKHYEPKLALVGGGPYGMELYERLFNELEQLSPPHTLSVTTLCEIDPSQAKLIASAWHAHFPQGTGVVLSDYGNLPRLFIGTSNPR